MVRAGMRKQKAPILICYLGVTFEKYPNTEDYIQSLFVEFMSNRSATQINIGHFLLVKLIRSKQQTFRAKHIKME